MNKSNVCVNVVADIARLMKGKEHPMEVEGGITLLDLLTNLVEKHGDHVENRLFESKGVITKDIRVMVNGKDIAFLDDLNTKLKHGDVVSVIPIISGG